MTPQCTGCHQTPEQIVEFIMLGFEQGQTPSQYVRENVENYNDRNGHFICNACFPPEAASSDGGWLAL